MPRHYAIGNGSMLINLDRYTRIRDLYYPYVGQLNHVGGYPCRIGIWAEGTFVWLSDEGWRWTPGYVPDSLVTRVLAEHDKLGITLEINDGVHQRDNIYLKRIRVVNKTESEREIRLFFTQDFAINETEVGDTAAFYPHNRTVFHYKKNRYFMANGLSGGEGISQYSMGVKRFHLAEGTWRDAEDGHLGGNSIAQGSVDSTIGFRMRLGAGEGKTRADHLEIAAQLYALVAEARRISDLAEVVGADALSDRERGYLGFADAFETGFVDQNRDELRTLEATLERAWSVASMLPQPELTMVSEPALASYYTGDRDGDADSTG